MATQASSAGPFRFRIGSLAVGEQERIDTRTEEAGPRNKRGGLKKFYGQRGGFDFVSVTNASDEVVTVQTNGGVNEDIPPATTKTISGASAEGSSESESTVYTFAQVENTGFVTSAAISANLVTVSFGNNPRPEERQDAVAFDPLSIIPGVVRRG